MRTRLGRQVDPWGMGFNASNAMMGKPPGGVAPVFALSFLNGQTLPQGLTFSRASTGWYFDASGNIVSAANDVARMDYHPFTRTALGILLEEQRTNLSPRWMGATTDWTGTNCSITNTGQTIQGQTAYTLTTTSTGAAQFGFLTTGPSVLTASVRHVVHVRVKRGNHPRVQLTTSNNHFLAAAADAYANYNFDTDTLTVGGSSLPAPTGGRTLLWDGSVQLWLAFTSGSAPTGGAAALLAPIDADAAVRLAGTATNGATVHFLGVQLEVGAYPTSPIISTGTALTRASDQTLLSGTAFSSWYNQAGGTVRLRGMFGFPDADSLRRWWDISDGTVANRIQGARAQSATPGTVAPSSVASVAESAPTTVNTVAGFATVSAVIQFSASGKRVSMNGGAVASTATSPPVAGMTQLILGAQPGYAAANILNGWIQSIEFFNKRDFTDAELQVLST